MSLFGAIGTGMKQPLFSCYEKCDSKSVKDFFSQILDNLTEPGKMIYLVMDNLGAHKSEVDLYTEEIKPLFYPPYSCRFNSIETLWSQVKSRFKMQLQSRLKQNGSAIKNRDQLSQFVFEMIEDIPIATIRNIEKANWSYIQSILRTLDPNRLTE